MANRTERIGVNHCGEIAERNNWLFREQPVNDIGIDAHIEFVDATGKPKQLLALQIKTGESWFKEQKDDCVIFRDTYGTEDDFEIRLVKQGLPIHLVSKLTRDQQLKNLTFDENNIVHCNSDFLEYYQSLDDFYRYQIDKYIYVN